MFTTSVGVVSLKNLLESGRFIVPDFQRNYAWEAKQVNEFWNDLEFVTRNKEEHFVGSVILLSENEATDLQVIDGQQRLTTIFMLISLIRDLMLEEETQNLQTPVQTFDVSHEPISMLFSELSSAQPRFEGNAQIKQDFLDCVIRNPNDQKRRKFKKKDRSETRRLRKAYLFLDKTVRDYVMRNAGEDSQTRLRVLHDLFQTILKDLKIMSISSSNRKEAVTIYMTLNNRGLGLSPSDLVKSLLIRFVSKNNLGEGFLESREVLKKWSQIVENVGDDSLDQFLRHYQLVYGRRENSGSGLLSIREKDIFSIFERDIQGEAKDPVPNPSERAFIVLEDLIKKSQTYSRFLKFDYPDPDDIQKKFDLSFRGLYSISDSYRIALLALLDEDLDLSLSDLAEWIQYIESLALRWIIVGGNAQVLENLYQATALDFLKLKSESEKIGNSLRKRFSDNMQSNESVSARLMESLDDSTLVRYISFKLNEKLGGEMGVLKFDPKLIHVEHIAPDTMTEEWKNALGITATDSEEVAAEYDDLSEKIGNKTLLEYKINSAIQNKSFSTKKDGLITGGKRIKGYKDSAIKLTEDLLVVDSWSREIIDIRTKWFAEMFNIIWGHQTTTRVVKFTTWLTK
jgi:uncharacterized protein with ParB-like and HNH nuclease domain